MTKARRGFSLIEITVGAAVFSVVMSAAFFLLTTYGRVAAKGEAISSAMNDGRQAITKASDDIRNSRYLYHYTQVGFESGLKVDGESIALGLPSGKLTYPLVTSGPFLENAAVKFPPFTGYTDSSGPLATDSITMMTGSLASPSYVSWMRHPGPADIAKPSTAENAWKELWYRLIRVQMDCTEFSADSTQGKWLDMSQKWSTFGAHPASRSVLTFVATKKKVGNQTCEISDITVFGHAANTDSPIFTWQNPHPYSSEGPLSPYWVEISLQMGDPLNQYLRTGSSSIAVAVNAPADCGQEGKSPCWHMTPITLRGKAYAQNVTMPGAI
ncbi:MAG: type II secretion system protein [Candidatus Sericytochromatia bacterium]|nr:type II secretion system protein [Candidatus Tanganyikabacteria bacterium]